AAAELTRSAVQSFAQVQPFEPGHTFEPVAVHAYQSSYDALNGHGAYGGYSGYGAVEVYEEPPVYAEEIYEAAVYDSVQAFQDDYSTQSYPAQAHGAHSTGKEIDLRPAAAVPVQQAIAAHAPLTPAAAAASPILAAAYEQPAAPSAPRPLRPAVLSVREDVGFDVAGAIAGPGAEPYTVPGVVMPRQREDGMAPALPPGRPVPPERLYRPYLADGTAGATPIDLTMHDETQQLSKVDHRQTGTA
ncbi:MAG: hypothetical protein ACJ786_10620, partial [Catenulispora sp.]